MQSETKLRIFETCYIFFNETEVITNLVDTKLTILIKNKLNKI